MQELPGDTATIGRIPGAMLLRTREMVMAVNGAGVDSQRDMDSIGVWIPADVRRLPLLRTVAETVMLAADFTLDIVTDIRVALDEVITAMILSAASGSRIDCEIGYNSEQVRVTMSAVLRHADSFELNAFGMHLLEAITDSIEIGPAEFDAGSEGHRLTVCFSRRVRSGGRR